MHREGAICIKERVPRRASTRFKLSCQVVGDFSKPCASSTPGTVHCVWLGSVVFSNVHIGFTENLPLCTVSLVHVFDLGFRSLITFSVTYRAAIQPQRVAVWFV